MPWHVAVDGSAVRLLHDQADDEGPFWSGVVRIHRGAPDFNDPELSHALISVEDPANHRAWVRHRWTYEIPHQLDGVANSGQNRRFLILRAEGAINWTLILLMPYQCPRFVFQAIARGFGATPQPLPKKEKSMPKPSNDSVAVVNTLNKGDVPEAKVPPPAFKEGVNTIVSQDQ